MLPLYIKYRSCQALNLNFSGKKRATFLSRVVLRRLQSHSLMPLLYHLLTLCQVFESFFSEINLNCRKSLVHKELRRAGGGARPKSLPHKNLERAATTTKGKLLEQKSAELTGRGTIKALPLRA